MKKIWISLMMWALALPLFAAKVDTILVKSNNMNKNIKVVTIIPDIAKEKACPVVYLLHGHGGCYNSWIVDSKPNLPQLADEKGMIMICPDGEKSWYWDSPLHSDMRYETFISSELIQYVDAHYHTIAGPKGRAITGLSMGGHGAMWNAIRHTDVFGAAGSTSGGLDIRPFPDSWNMKDQLGEKSKNPQVWEDHTVINLVPSMKNGELAMIIDCGYDDFFFEVNNKFHEALLKQGIDHDFYVRPGSHTHSYWSRSIEYQLVFFDQFFRTQNKKK